MGSRKIALNRGSNGSLLYLNSAYLGGGAWGVEMAARSYFGKSAQDLSVAEGAMLAGLLKGPSFFNPDHHPDRAKERLAYVLGRMKEDGISAEDKDRALAAPPKLLAFAQRRRDSGLHFIDFLGREAKTDGVTSLTAEPYTVHSTINAALQREAETSLQEGLARFEMSSGRTQFRGPEANLGDAIQKLGAGGAAPAARLDAGKPIAEQNASPLLQGNNARARQRRKYYRRRFFVRHPFPDPNNCDHQSEARARLG